MTFHEPDLEKVFADEVLSFEFQDFVHEGDLVIYGFLLEKDETQVTRLTERVEGGLVKIAFVGAHPAEHVYDDSGIDCLVNKVSFHRNRCERKIAWRRRGCKRESWAKGGQCCLAQHTFFQRFLRIVTLDSRYE